MWCDEDEDGTDPDPEVVQLTAADGWRTGRPSYNRQAHREEGSLRAILDQKLERPKGLFGALASGPKVTRADDINAIHPGTVRNPYFAF